jgi:hypothetical protein
MILFIGQYLYLHASLYHGIFCFQPAGCIYFRNYFAFVQYFAAWMARNMLGDCPQKTDDTGLRVSVSVSPPGVARKRCKKRGKAAHSKGFATSRPRGSGAKRLECAAFPRSGSAREGDHRNLFVQGLLSGSSATGWPCNGRARHRTFAPRSTPGLLIPALSAACRLGRARCYALRRLRSGRPIRQPRKLSGFRLRQRCLLAGRCGQALLDIQALLYLFEGDAFGFGHDEQDPD